VIGVIFHYGVVTDAGLKELSAFKQLTSLDLSGATR